MEDEDGGVGFVVASSLCDIQRRVNRVVAVDRRERKRGIKLQGGRMIKQPEEQRASVDHEKSARRERAIIKMLNDRIK